MSKLKITTTDLYNIYENSLSDFKEKSNNQLNSKEFIAKCYTDNLISLLKTNGIDINIVYEHEERFNVEPLDE